VEIGTTVSLYRTAGRACRVMWGGRGKVKVE
jgi:hypothetical protein